MIEAYLVGSINQSLHRIRHLRQIVHGTYRREYDGLRQICLTHLDASQELLQCLAEETVVTKELQTPRRVREFARIVEQLETVENVGAFALSRVSHDDDFLNRLITDVCREIKYPLIPPVVSHISQDYFHIYLNFNLLCLPLVESRFLLHLPDIYHELCHLFHREQNADLPLLKAYHDAFDLHWNVDHLLDLPVADLTGACILRTPECLEARLGQFLECDPHTIVVEKGLGANDVPGNTHLLVLAAGDAWWAMLPERLSDEFGF